MIMKKAVRLLLFGSAVSLTILTISCEDEDGSNCTGCPDDAPYGTLAGGCYATLSACNENESGNCTICQ